ncbi:MAG: hypothetical protein JNM22_20110 [Saprospiraceae bacterium]|nr:hypothetical protein [Saprospiraceae bacterium]
MTLLFWLLWIFDLLISVILVIAGDFRRSFTNNNPMAWAPALMLVCVVAAPLARFVFKRPTAGLVLAAMPVLLLLLWYGVDKAKS